MTSSHTIDLTAKVHSCPPTDSRVYVQVAVVRLVTLRQWPQFDAAMRYLAAGQSDETKLLDH